MPEENQEPVYQIAIDLGFDVTPETTVRYEELYGQLHDVCFSPGKVISSPVLIKREEYNPNRHAAFMAIGEDVAKEIERKIKKSGLASIVHLDKMN